MKKEDVLYAIYRLIMMDAGPRHPTSSPYDKEVRRLKDRATAEAIRKLYNCSVVAATGDTQYRVDRMLEPELENFLMTHGHLVAHEGSILRVLTCVAGVAAGLYEREYAHKLVRYMRRQHG